MDENEFNFDESMNARSSNANEPLNPSKKCKEMGESDDDDLIEILKAKILSENHQLCSQQNEDRFFLLSLVSELQKVPANKKLQVKIGVLNII